MADKKEEKRCRRCGRTANKGDSYCGRCGSPVVNRCLGQGELTGEPCSHVNGEDAAFCTKCGSATAYQRAGLLSALHGENKVLSRDDWQEMQWFRHPFFTE